MESILITNEPSTYATPASITTVSSPSSVASTVLWTVAGVGTLVLLGKGIAAAGNAAGLPDACWQLTGARAAAVSGTLGTVVAARRGHVALFGALYAAYLFTAHAPLATLGSVSTATFSSAIVAGLGAWLVATRLSGRGMAVRLLATVATFNALMTLGSLIKTIDGTSRGGAGGYASGLGMRLLATAVVCAAIVGVSKMLDRARNDLHKRTEHA